MHTLKHSKSASLPAQLSGPPPSEYRLNPYLWVRGTLMKTTVPKQNQIHAPALLTLRDWPLESFVAFEGLRALVVRNGHRPDLK
jgi:hypothetical protein